MELMDKCGVMRITSHNYDITNVYPDSIVPFHKDFSPSGEQLELRKLAHEL